MPAWKYAMELGYFPPGTRDNSLTILAATYKYLRYNQTKALYSLQAAADLQAEIHGQEPKADHELRRIINSVYNENWKGGTYSIENAPTKLIEYLESHQEV